MKTGILPTLPPQAHGDRDEEVGRAEGRGRGGRQRREGGPLALGTRWGAQRVLLLGVLQGVVSSSSLRWCTPFDPYALR